MNQLTSISNYISYFKTLAQNNTTLAHADGSNETFGVIDLAQMQVNTTFKDWAMVLEYPESNFTDRGDSPIEDLTAAFWLIKKPSSSKHADVYAALESTKALAREIIARIWYDYRNNNLLDFDLNTIRMNKLGPWESNFYGWRIELQINTDAQLTFDDSKWSDI